MTVGFVLRRIDCNNGIASHLETLMRGLTRAGVKVVLLTGPIHCREVAPERFESLTRLATEWIVLDVPTKGVPLSRSAIQQISQTIKRLDIELLHLHGLSTLPLARLSVGFKHIPVVATAHPSGTSTRGPGKRVRQIIRMARAILRKIYLPEEAIAISTELQSWFIDDLQMRPSHVHRIFHGVDAQHFRPPSEIERADARQFFGVSARMLCITLIGRYEPVKRHDILIDAIQEISGKCENIQVLFVGSGGGEDDIRQLVRASGLADRIKLYGQRDAREVYWASDVVVLPSDREGFPLVIIEAMLCGVVPIRTDTAGAFDQILQGEDGYVFPIGQTAELARLLAHLYDNPALRLKMADAAACSAKNKFDSSLMTARTLEIYRSLIGPSELELSQCVPDEVVTQRR